MVQNKCKNCGGELIFDVGTQSLVCNHCSSVVEIEGKEKMLEKTPLTNESTIALSKTEYSQYTCQTCGRQHLSSSDTPLTRCPSCGDYNLTKTVKVDYVPDGLISFKINKETAITKLYSWLSKRHFTPNNLKSQATADTLVGVYSPAFSYDFDTFTKYSGIGVGTKRDRNGHTYTTRKNFSGTRNDNFKDYLESAGDSISSVKLRNIGPFSTNKVLCYSTEYLYGWIGEAINCTLQDNANTMKQDVNFSIKRKVELSQPYERIENFKCETTFENIKYNYLYLPIYKGTYKYKQKKYTYFVNGENGKVTGRTPKSFWKIFFTVLSIGAIVGAIVYLTVKYLG